MIVFVLGTSVGWTQAVVGTVWIDASDNEWIDDDRPVGGVMVLLENLEGTFAAAYTTGSDGFFAIGVPSEFVPDTFFCVIHESTLPEGTEVVLPVSGGYLLELTAEEDYRNFEEVKFLIAKIEEAPGGSDGDPSPYPYWLHHRDRGVLEGVSIGAETGSPVSGEESWLGRVLNRGLIGWLRAKTGEGISRLRPASN